jgi:hypothetical protein
MVHRLLVPLVELQRALALAPVRAQVKCLSTHSQCLGAAEQEQEEVQVEQEEDSTHSCLAHQVEEVSEVPHLLRILDQQRKSTLLS